MDRGPAAAPAHHPLHAHTYTSPYGPRRGISNPRPPPPRHRPSFTESKSSQTSRSHFSDFSPSLLPCPTNLESTPGAPTLLRRTAPTTTRTTGRRPGPDFSMYGSGGRGARRSGARRGATGGRATPGAATSWTRRQRRRRGAGSHFRRRPASRLARGAPTSRRSATRGPRGRGRQRAATLPGTRRRCPRGWGRTRARPGFWRGARRTRSRAGTDTSPP